MLGVGVCHLTVVSKDRGNTIQSLTISPFQIMQCKFFERAELYLKKTTVYTENLCAIYRINSLSTSSLIYTSPFEIIFFLCFCYLFQMIIDWRHDYDSPISFNANCTRTNGRLAVRALLESFSCARLKFMHHLIISELGVRVHLESK